MLQKLKRLALSSVNYNLTLKGATGSLKIPVINDVGRAHLDTHEPHMEALFNRLYTPGTVLIDVGVNIGQTLVKYVSVAGRQGRYVGFEPNARAASYVDRLISRNVLSNAMVIPVGLGATTRIASLLVGTEGGTDPGASINAEIRDTNFYGGRQAVAVFNGDDVLAELELDPGPMLIKIDVEGAELEVLTGLTKTLRDVRPRIIVEVLPPTGFSDKVNSYRSEQAEKLRQMMARSGYSEYAVGLTGELLKGLSPTCDYLFLPSEDDVTSLGLL